MNRILKSLWKTIKDCIKFFIIGILVFLFLLGAVWILQGYIYILGLVFLIIGIISLFYDNYTNEV